MLIRLAKESHWAENVQQFPGKSKTTITYAYKKI